jgi:DNA polymerase III psi subunit
MSAPNTNTFKAAFQTLAQNPAFVEQFLTDDVFIVHSRTANKPSEFVDEEPSAAPIQPKAQEIPATVTPTPTEPMAPSAVTKVESPITAINTPEQPTSVPWLNKIVLLLPSELSMAEIEFLNKILEAVKVSDDQVYHREGSWQAKQLSKFTGSRIILSFGAVTDFKPDHQIRSKLITVVITSSLAQLQQDVQAKKLLWTSLQTFFK